MKHKASRFGDIIWSDTQKLTSIESQQDKHLLKTEIENERIRKLEQKARVGFCMRMITLFFAMAVFVFMMGIIKFFPRWIK